jgi:preprotein translocase subunit SecY
LLQIFLTDALADYIDSVVSRLTASGALYITAVCLLPEFLILYWNVPFYFGGTSLLIIVVVVMDFIAQAQSHLMSNQYEEKSLQSNQPASPCLLIVKTSPLMLLEIK